MIYLVHVPERPLSLFMERLWFFEGHFPDHSKERVQPNGSMELLIELRNGSKKLYDPNNGNAFRSFKRSWISGAQSGPIIIEAAQNSTGEVTGDGKMITKSEYLKNGQWVNGHEAVYKEDPKAQVIFK